MDSETSQWACERKKLVGVRMRKPGKFVSEIWDSTIQKRVWLGTFPTAEAAHNAYLSRKQEIQDKLEMSKHREESLSVEDSKTWDWFHSKEKEEKVSDDEEKFGLLNGVKVIDTNGFFVGEFRKLDDLSIPTTEDGEICHEDINSAIN